MSTANGSPDILESGGNDSRFVFWPIEGMGHLTRKRPSAHAADGADMTLGHFMAMPGHLDLAVYFGGQTNQIPCSTRVMATGLSTRDRSRNRRFTFSAALQPRT